MFLDKNRDTLRPDLLELLQGSRSKVNRNTIYMMHSTINLPTIYML